MSTPTSSNTRTLYTLYLTLDYAGHSASVSEDIRYTNTTGQSLSEIVMAVEPNLWTDCFDLRLLDEDGAPANNYTLDGQKLTITLAQSLPEGATTTISVGYRLSMPLKSGDAPFGYRSDQLNLTDWYPFIVPFDGEWVLHDPWSFGEHLVYDSADFDVYVIVKDAGITVAASAPAVVNGTSTAYHLEGARAFALSASDSYRRIRGGASENRSVFAARPPGRKQGRGVDGHAIPRAVRGQVRTLSLPKPEHRGERSGRWTGV